MPFATISPVTGDVLERHEAHDERETQRRLAAAANAFERWRRVPPGERAAAAQRLAGLLDRERDRLARLITTEMGKPIGAARAEVEKCAWVCRYYAEHAVTFLADDPAPTDARRSFVTFQPLGVVLSIMPWNFPFWQVFRFAVPAVMAGNTSLLKHASSTPGCALAIEALFGEAGFPPGVLATLLIEHERIPEVIADDRIAAVTLTGSERAGRSVGENAGRSIKKSVLELGGSDPFIVMPSADLARAAGTAVRARMINNGQSCIAAKRFIVHQAVADEFERLFVEHVQALRVGDPMEEETQIGPLATASIVEGVERQVRASVDAGARILTGGSRRDDRGYFFEPTVLVDAPPGSPAREEEIFGPVATILRAADIDSAIRLANETRFGLGASAWTTDRDETQRFIAELASGMVFINAMVASDPRLPFGGVKNSGYGRELGLQGIREFVNVKSVWVED